MVAPKHKVLQLTNRNEIKEAYSQLGKLTPNKKAVMLLIDVFNNAHGFEALTWSGYCSCGDCQRAIKTFFTWILKEWEKTS